MLLRNPILQFETFTESHYSQTKDAYIVLAELFETFIESHYSQTLFAMHTEMH